jgi:hypothetical protein
VGNVDPDDESNTVVEADAVETNLGRVTPIAD